MKYLILTLFTLFPLFAISDSLPEIDGVEQLLWKNRIVLIWSDEPLDVRHIIEGSQYEIDDRDIVWFIVDGQNVDTNYNGFIASNFVEHINSKYFKLGKKVILIGKDGGVKYVDGELKLPMLLNKIDSMPMRMNEIQNQK